MSKAKGRKISTVIAYVLLIIAVFALIGFVVKFTNGGTTGIKTFYIKVGNTIYTDKGEVRLSLSPVRFDVKYTFGSLTGANNGYEICIVPYVNDETDFDFIVDGQTYRYGAEKDLTKAFNVVCDDKGFTIMGENRDMAMILQRLYEGQTVELPEIDASENVYFKLLVTNYNKTETVEIGLRLSPVVIITTDKGCIVL